MAGGRCRKEDHYLRYGKVGEGEKMCGGEWIQCINGIENSNSTPHSIEIDIICKLGEAPGIERHRSREPTPRPDLGP